MKITFKTLDKSDFPLLLKWLNSPHIKNWWDPDVKWTAQLVEEKYSSYVVGYKHTAAGDPKPIKACIIQVDGKPVGYIQGYNAYDFEREIPLQHLPSSMIAFDIYIGEPDYLGQGIASKAIALFFDEFYAMYFDYAFADPETDNYPAIHAYENAGFKKFKQFDTFTWMIKSLR